MNGIRINVCEIVCTLVLIASLPTVVQGDCPRHHYLDVRVGRCQPCEKICGKQDETDLCLQYQECSDFHEERPAYHLVVDSNSIKSESEPVNSRKPVENNGNQLQAGIQSRVAWPVPTVIVVGIIMVISTVIMIGFTVSLIRRHRQPTPSNNNNQEYHDPDLESTDDAPREIEMVCLMPLHRSEGNSPGKHPGLDLHHDSHDLEHIEMDFDLDTYSLDSMSLASVHFTKSNTPEDVV